jgi:hypothetical protein
MNPGTILAFVLLGSFVRSFPVAFRIPPQSGEGECEFRVAGRMRSSRLRPHSQELVFRRRTVPVSAWQGLTSQAHDLGFALDGAVERRDEIHRFRRPRANSFARSIVGGFAGSTGLFFRP